MAGWVLVTTLALSACDSGDSGGHTAKPSLRVSVPPAPAQTGTKQVRFDPCVEIGDDVVSRVGFDPTTRERDAGEIVSDLLTSIGCSFTRTAVVNGEKALTGSVTIKSINQTLDEIRANDRRSVFDSAPINGREAVLYKTPNLPGMCSAAVSSPDGILDVGLVVFPGPAQVPTPCDQIRELAVAFTAPLGTK
ncbi:DUF3558 domain-containing protein [Nocardia sp. NPDC051570]|uniref:DUF3558 domain-containing protein n=1 Tax=Nocardia sp. NPDC051570 TaxID=3364324 RepID=UPI00379BA6B3